MPLTFGTNPIPNFATLPINCGPPAWGAAILAARTAMERRPYRRTPWYIGGRDGARPSH